MKDWLGGPKPQCYEIQAMKIAELQKEVQNYIDKDYEIL